ncbi:uncharacterized protein LOC117224951 [Megalopta genalis]|uniref:uncharacterized protein LOC117224951 n=1 Tax=Megalopta genalis TaxID=115081 RepID=UPI003FD06DB8
MGKRTARSLYGLTIFVFLLYFAKDSISTSIIDVMRNDGELNRIPVFLYNDTNISTCVNVSYSERNITDYASKYTLLCLAFYDTWYKVSKSSLWSDRFNNNFTDAKTFNYYLLKFVPKEKNDDSEIKKFCESIKGITFSYEKLKPLLSRLQHINRYDMCRPICFDMDRNFTPLCEILAWSKSIDNEIQKVNNESQTGLESKKVEKPKKLSEETQNLKDQKLSNESQVTTSKSQDGTKALNNIDNNEDKSAAAHKEKTRPLNSERKLNPVEDEKHTNDHTISQQKSTIELTHSKDVNKAQDSQNVNEKPHNDKIESQNVIEPPHSDKQEPKNVNEESHRITQNINEATHSEVKELQNTNKESEELGVNTAKENNEELNKEDKQIEWNNAEDNGLMDDQNNTGEPDAPIDTDQSQNKHKPIDEKDNMSSFRTMRTDEESHFFTYFTILSLISIAAYIGYYNKQKILAIVLEGRRSRNSRGRRRPSTANYRKLDCTLEEAVTSQCNANVTHVIY